MKQFMLKYTVQSEYDAETETVTMSDTPRSNSSTPPNNPEPEAIKVLFKKLGVQWVSWLLEVSTEIQPIIKETIIFGLFILGEQLIISWTGPGFAEVVKKYPPVDGLYDIIK